MNLFSLISIVCYTNYANSLSLEFTATESPNGIVNLGEGKVRAICDPTRECELDTQSRSRCHRWGCCWHPTSKKCVSKKYFILESVLESVAPKIEYKLTVVKRKMLWEDARQHCADNFEGGVLIQHDPRVLTIKGRSELVELLNLSEEDYYLIGIRRFWEDLPIDGYVYKRAFHGEDGEILDLDGWSESQNFPVDWTYYDFVNWHVDPSYPGHHNTIFNVFDSETNFICEHL